MFAVEVERDARGAVLALRGELDFDSVVQLNEAGAAEVARESSGPVVVDCSALAFCDSSGIGAVLRLYQGLAGRGRELRLASVPPRAARLFSLTGLDQLFTLYEDADAALAAGAGPRVGRSA
ncbi:STAS domain-containing protein [Streptomyces sp. NPDC060194]|uniref:STAS domain-containing protein n=1 Tax=Streptomyces sp. NPDC060194 TaxID=3347069 RepID=UPI0036581D4D